MFNTKRKRAVVLALIAFFCGATAVVGVDWKRFGGGFLAFFNPKSEPVPAYASAGAPAGGGILAPRADSHSSAAPQLALAAPSSRTHTSNVGGGSGAHKGDDDLFKYGDPAAGGMPPGSFVVAQNDTSSGGGTAGAGAAPSVESLSAAAETAAPSGGDAGSGGVGSPAPAPSGGTDSGDGGIIVKTPAPSPTPTPSPSPTPVVSTPTPPAPAPTPTQSGTSDQDPGNGGGDTPPPPIVVTTPPVSAVPEASNAAMMGLGALFLAVAATRRRKDGQA